MDKNTRRLLWAGVLGIWFHGFALVADALTPPAHAQDNAMEALMAQQRYATAGTGASASDAPLGELGNPVHVVIDEGCR